jgi:hypothetical protein
VEVDKEKVTALLMEIRPLLAKADFSASDYVEKLQGIIGMEELAETIDDYDFLGALKILDTLI